MRDSTKTKQTAPTYRLHKTSGRAIVTLPAFGGKRRDIFLGRYGTDESRQRYAQVIAEWTAMGDVRPHPTSDITIVELVDRYWAHDLARRGLLDQGSIVVLPLVNQGVTGYPSWRDCPTTGTRVPIVVLHDEAIARRSGLFVKREKLFEWTLTHEIGHALGLFHTTEAPVLVQPLRDGTHVIHDQLADTPACPENADLNHDGSLSAAECGAFDGSNLLFWDAAGRGGVHLTPEQSAAIERSALVR